MSPQQLKTWAPWLIVAVLGLLWVWLLYVLSGCIVGFQMAYRPLCGAYLPIALLVIPVPIVGILGFIIGKRFGRRNET